MNQAPQKRFVILMAPPGGGKSTQAALLKKKMEEVHSDVIHVTTGGSFREFIQGDNFIAKQARDVQNAGGLQPEFLSIWNWTNIFIHRLGENTSVILDGAPRKVVETEALHKLFTFLGYTRIDVIYLEVTSAWAKDRQKSREAKSEEKRVDASTDEEIEKRILLFYEEILPCVEIFKNDPRYSFARINGERSIEEIHTEIMEKLNTI
jgi:adenylate kinase family enzyme